MVSSTSNGWPHGCLLNFSRRVNRWRRIGPWILYSSALALALSRAAAAQPDTNTVADWLSRTILAPEQTMRETQTLAEKRVPVLKSYKSVQAWEKDSDQMREDLLAEVALRGEAMTWAKAKTKVEWLEAIPGGPGYRIRKLRYEAVPGLWIPALLYEPEAIQGKVPVVLNVNGHDGQGKAASYKQLRCINQAKRGMLALNPEWFGMGQLNHTNYQHYRMNQLDLCGTSGLAPFYLAMKRALDLLLDLPQADPARVAVSGLSGGGWQTIFISALDKRVTLSNPVAGYSSFRTRVWHLEDLGDSEQTPCDMATIADYSHLTAMLAPRPALLTYNSKDNCCFASGHALQPLLDAAKPIYQLYQQEPRLRSHVNDDPGDHNFGEDNRRAHYRILGDFFYPESTGYPTNEIPSEAEIQTLDALRVELPADNATFHSLAMSLSRDLPRNGALPGDAAQAQKWQASQRLQLGEVLKVRPYRPTAQWRPAQAQGLRKVVHGSFQMRSDWTVPAVEVSPPLPKATALVIHDEGKIQATNLVEALLEQNYKVIALDLFYFGECRLPKRDSLFALLLSSVGERPMGIQAGQLDGVARWAQREYRNLPVTVHAWGPRSSLIALVAAALYERHIESVELYQSMGSLKQVLEENWTIDRRPEWFCFGLLESFDVLQMAALVAPRAVVFHQAGPRVNQALGALPAWYELLGSPHKLLLK